MQSKSILISLLKITRWNPIERRFLKICLVNWKLMILGK